MIPLDHLKNLKRAIVHANCPDGVASALVLKDALPDLDVRFVKYDTEEHKAIVPEPNTIFCDFSPWLPKLTDPSEVLMEREDLIKAWNAAGCVVLDHHSKDIVEPYTYGVFGENDKLECGAMLAYEHVWVPVQRSYLGAPLQPGDPSCRGREAMEVENFARLSAIRDTWKKNDPDWEAANHQASILMFFRFEQLSLDLLEDLQEGPLALRLFERQIELAHSCIKEAVAFTSDKGTRVLMFQGVSATSDAAEILEKRCVPGGEPWVEKPGTPPGTSRGLQPDLVVGFHYRTDGGLLKLQFSTRSHTSFDCQKLARAHGGDGHTAAAGFTVPASEMMNPYDLFGSLLNVWEKR